MWRSVEPTTSMSTARKQRCTEVRRGAGRRRRAQEELLEGLHAGGREQHRLVERRGHERGRRHGDVPALHEEVRERAADLVGCPDRAHGSPIL